MQPCNPCKLLGKNTGEILGLLVPRTPIARSLPLHLRGGPQGLGDRCRPVGAAEEVDLAPEPPRSTARRGRRRVRTAAPLTGGFNGFGLRRQRLHGSRPMIRES